MMVKKNSILNVVIGELYLICYSEGKKQNIMKGIKTSLFGNIFKRKNEWKKRKWERELRELEELEKKLKERKRELEEKEKRKKTFNHFYHVV